MLPAVRFLPKVPQGTFFTPHCNNRKTIPKDGFSVGSAGERNRTPDYCLEGSRFTTKLHPLFKQRRDNIFSSRKAGGVSQNYKNEYSYSFL